MIYNVRNPNEGGKGNRAQKYSDRQIADFIRSCRSFLIYADQSKRQSVNVGFVQDMGCVPMQRIDQADCDNYEWGQYVRKVTIPQVIDLPENMGLVFFGMIDKRTTIYLPSVLYGSLNDALPLNPYRDYEAYQIGQTIYVRSKNSDKAEKLCAVNIRGIFSDPTLVSCCDADGNEKCFDWDATPYPIPPHLEVPLYQMVNDRFINPQAAMAPNTTPDDKPKTAA